MFKKTGKGEVTEKPKTVKEAKKMRKDAEDEKKKSK